MLLKQTKSAVLAPSVQFRFSSGAKHVVHCRRDNFKALGSSKPSIMIDIFKSHIKCVRYKQRFLEDILNLERQEAPLSTRPPASTIASTKTSDPFLFSFFFSLGNCSSNFLID